MVLPSGAAIIVYSPSGIGAAPVLQPNSSPKKLCALAVSFVTYSNHTKRPVVMGNSFLVFVYPGVERPQRRSTMPEKIFGTADSRRDLARLQISQLRSGSG